MHEHACVYTWMHMPPDVNTHIHHMAHIHKELLMNSVTPKASSLTVLAEAAPFSFNPQAWVPLLSPSSAF